MSTGGRRCRRSGRRQFRQRRDVISVCEGGDGHMGRRNGRRLRFPLKISPEVVYGRWRNDWLSLACGVRCGGHGVTLWVQEQELRCRRLKASVPLRKLPQGKRKKISTNGTWRQSSGAEFAVPWVRGGFFVRKDKLVCRCGVQAIYAWMRGTGVHRPGEEDRARQRKRKGGGRENIARRGWHIQPQYRNRTIGVVEGEKNK